MKKVIPPTIKLIYLNEPDSNERFRRAYCRIFSGLKEEILRKKKLQQEGGEQLNMRKYALYVWIPKDLSGDDEWVEARIAALKKVASENNMTVIKTLRELGDSKAAFKEMWSDIYEKSVTGILCDDMGDLADGSSLQSLLYKLLFEMEVEIRTPSYLFRKDLPNDRCYTEIVQEGAKW